MRCSLCPQMIQNQERGSVYLQGNCTSSASNGVNISVRLEGKRCSRRSPSFSSSAQLALLVEDKTLHVSKVKASFQG